MVTTKVTEVLFFFWKAGEPLKSNLVLIQIHLHFSHFEFPDLRRQDVTPFGNHKFAPLMGFG